MAADNQAPIYAWHIREHSNAISRNGEPFLVLSRASSQVSPDELQAITVHIVNLLNDAAGVAQAGSPE
jgi:hypothetical protein